MLIFSVDYDYQDAAGNLKAKYDLFYYACNSDFFTLQAAIEERLKQKYDWIVIRRISFLGEAESLKD